MKKVLVLFLAFLYSLTTIGAHGLVYCQDIEGNVAIEMAHEKTHCAGVHGQLNEEILACGDPCGFCFDTPLEVDDQLASQRDGSLLYLDFLFLEESLHFVSKNFFELDYFSIPPPRMNPTLVSLRTVVLLV